MTVAAFNAVRVPMLAKKLRCRSAELAPYLTGMDHVVCRLRCLPDRSRLDLQTLHSIVTEKSTRRAALANGNNPEVVERITHLAFSVDDDLVPLKLLCVLDGVNVPTASAILSWMFPERWPVIDQRAWRTLHKAEVVTSRPKGTGLGFAQWRVYLQAIRELQDALGGIAPTPQRVDRLLYGLDILRNSDGRQ